MVQTFTGLKTEHATAVYKNYYKGDPPFKPQKGNFGKVSWFAGAGNAYVGGQAQTYTVDVDVRLDGEITKLGVDFFNEVMTNYIQRKKDNLSDTSTHGAFWKALGKELERYWLVEVSVPKCVVSQQGAGTFYGVSTPARLAVTLTNPAKLRQDLVNLQVNVNLIEQTVDNLKQNNEASFTLVFGAVKEDVKIHPAKMGPGPFVDKIATTYAVVGYVRPVSVRGRFDPVPVPPDTNKIIAMSRASQKTVTLSLGYADFGIARVQAKYWAMLESNVTIRNDYGGITLQGGAGWSQKATRAYTAAY